MPQPGRRSDHEPNLNDNPQSAAVGNERGESSSRNCAMINRGAWAASSLIPAAHVVGQRCVAIVCSPSDHCDCFDRGWVQRQKWLLRVLLLRLHRLQRDQLASVRCNWKLLLHPDRHSALRIRTVSLAGGAFLSSTRDCSRTR